MCASAYKVCEQTTRNVDREFAKLIRAVNSDGFIRTWVQSGSKREGVELRFENSGDGDERVSGAFYIGRASFRMQIQEDGVVSAPLIGGLTPARGIGYAPIDLDEGWEVAPVGDGDEPPPAAPAASINQLKTRARSIVAVGGAGGFIHRAA